MSRDPRAVEEAARLLEVDVDAILRHPPTGLEKRAALGFAVADLKREVRRSVEILLGRRST